MCGASRPAAATCGRPRSRRRRIACVALLKLWMYPDAAVTRSGDRGPEISVSRGSTTTAVNDVDLSGRVGSGPPSGRISISGACGSTFEAKIRLREDRFDDLPAHGVLSAKERRTPYSIQTRTAQTDLPSGRPTVRQAS